MGKPQTGGVDAEVPEKDKQPEQVSTPRYWHYGCSRDYAKVRFFKKECNKETFLVVKESKQGDKYYDLRSSKDLTTEEMTLCIQRFRDFCAFQGCYIPSPDEHEYLLYIEREQEKNKEYL